MGSKKGPERRWPGHRRGTGSLHLGIRLIDEDRNVLVIKGTANLHCDLVQALEENENALLFEYEEDKMYSQRESELIQKYLQEHGEMPGGGDSELDDLF